MSPYNEQECCPRFDPQPWERATYTWEERLFVKDRVTSLLHIPLNYGAVMARNLARIQAAGALAEPPLILTDENSLWGADVYFAVSREVQAAFDHLLQGEDREQCDDVAKPFM